MAGKIYPVRQHENRSWRNLRCTCLCPTCRIRSGKPVPDKALTISEADQFTRRGGHYRLHAIFMNQLCTIWGYQEELSSMAACPLAEDSCSIHPPDKAARPLRRHFATIQPPSDHAQPVLPAPMCGRTSDTEAPAYRLPRLSIRARPDELGVLGFKPTQPAERFLHAGDRGRRRRRQLHRLRLLPTRSANSTSERGHVLK